MGGKLPIKTDLCSDTVSYKNSVAPGFCIVYKKRRFRKRLSHAASFLHLCIKKSEP